MAKDTSPTASIRSIASTSSGTLSRPPPPLKPSHLSSAFTGTCNSIALRHYIQTHTTGGSFTTHSPSTATISRAHLGHGYDTSSVDLFVDAFDTSSDDENDVQLQSTSRPSARGRTYTAPSVSRVFDTSSDDQTAADGTTRLIRNEPISITGNGPSRVGNLRSMFEAAVPTSSTPAVLSRQNTGITSQHTGTKARPRISTQVRMLQAQITGDRFNGLAGAFHVADARSSVVVETKSNIVDHGRDATDQSDDASNYRTATQDLLGDSLKMDAVVMPPSSNTDTLKPSCSGSLPVASSALTDHMIRDSSSFDAEATISRSTSAKNGLISSSIPSITAQHDRDDSSATIRASHSNQEVAALPPSSPDAFVGTARRRSSRLISGSKRGRLSSIFTASPQSSRHSGGDYQNGTGISPSPSGSSLESCTESEAQSEAERSREPSMLIADDDDVSFSRTSHHLRANDGSCFDLDCGTSASPAKPTTVRRALLNATTASATLGADAGSQVNSQRALSPTEGEETTLDANPHRKQQASVDTVNTKAVSPGDDAMDAAQTSEHGRDTTKALGSTLDLTTASTLQAPRPISARMPQPGIGKPARALYDFEGEPAFNELVIRAGQPFDILNEQLAGGWSLGVVWDDNGVPTRGLVPQGWYCYIQDFTRSPPPSHGIEPPPTPDLVGQEPNAGDISLPPAAVASERDVSDAQSNEASNPIRHSQPPALKTEAERVEKQTTLEPRADDYDHKISTSTPPSEEQPALETQSPISVSAFLQMDHAAVQWQQVEQAEVKIDREGPAVHDSPKHVFANVPNSIDGMPAVSSKSNPIDWSAVAASQSTNDVAADVNTLDRQVEQATGSVVTIPETELTSVAGSDWKGSIFGKKTFNRFASFVTSGAEDYVLSSSDLGEDERSRTVARKVSGGKPTGALALTEVKEEEEGVRASAEAVRASADHHETNDHIDLTQVVRESATGAEASSADPNHHFVIAGPAGPKWKSKCPHFLVQVHHPQKRTKLNGMQEYTVYHVTSTYPVDKAEHGANDESDSASDRHGVIPYDPLGGPYPPGAQVTVLRRFTQFEWLHQVLAKHFSALLIPPLPEKQYSGRFASDFIETRRADLEMWISRLVRHPVLRYSEPIRFFLSCEDEVDWRTNAAILLRNGRVSQACKAASGGVFAQTWHPDFNFDSSEAAVEADRMETFLKALEKTINGVGGHNAGKHGILAAYKGHREGNVATSTSYRELSYTLLRTLTGAGTGPSDGKDSNAAFANDDAHRIHGPPMGNIGRRSETGATNEHGAWCWREDCADCVNLTSALQNTAECLQNVADIYESHARETLLRQHERFKEISRPHTMAQALLETHRTTLSRYREATGEVDPWINNSSGADPAGVDDRDTRNGSTFPHDTKQAIALAPEEAERLAARCETVINVTMSEMDRLHDERVEDYHTLGRNLLDGEIELYESILEQLKAARLHYDEEYYEREPDFHVLASRYQPELSRPKRPTAPLLMPSAAHGPPGGLRSAAGGVGLLISQATGGAGVTRPASVRVDSLYDRTPLSSPRAFDTSGGYRELDAGRFGNPSGAASGGRGGGGFMCNFLAPSTTKPCASPRLGGLVDSTNTAHLSSVDAALKTISVKNGQDALDSQQSHRVSSYFSAIWR